MQGWVGKVEALVQNDHDIVVLRGNVRHSQSISSPMVHPWVAAKRKGTVICAHCTCMAGLGEVCAHVGAILFHAEANTQKRKQTSCTSGPCSWLQPAGCKKVEYAPIADINFQSSRRKRKPVEITATALSPHASKHLTSEPTVEEIATFHESLSQSGTKSAVLSLLPQYCDKYTPRAEKGTLPKPLTDLYSKKYFDITTFSELLGECEGVCTQVTYMSEQHCKMVEEVTRNQGGSKMWHVYRAGRVTASNFKSAVHTSPDKPSTSLI